MKVESDLEERDLRAVGEADQKAGEERPMAIARRIEAKAEKRNYLPAISLAKGDDKIARAAQLERITEPRKIQNPLIAPTQVAIQPLVELLTEKFLLNEPSPCLYLK